MQPIERTLPCDMLVGKTRFVGTVTLVRDDARREEIVDMWTRFLADNLTKPKGA